MFVGCELLRVAAPCMETSVESPVCVGYFRALTASVVWCLLERSVGSRKLLWASTELAERSLRCCLAFSLGAISITHSRYKGNDSSRSKERVRVDCLVVNVAQTYRKRRLTLRDAEVQRQKDKVLWHRQPLLAL